MADLVRYGSILLLLILFVTAVSSAADSSSEVTKDAEHCASIESQHRRDECYYSAGKGGDTSICDNIVSTERRDLCRLNSKKALNSFWVMRFLRMLVSLVAYAFFVLWLSKQVKSDSWQNYSYTKKGTLLGLLAGGLIFAIFETIRLFSNIDLVISFIAVPFGVYYFLFVVHPINEMLHSTLLLEILGSSLVSALLMGSWGAAFGHIYSNLKKQGHGLRRLIAIIVSVYLVSIIVTLFVFLGKA